MDFVSKKINFENVDECQIIGEIGVNHNGNIETLFELIEQGANAGVDIIKLQRFNSELEISKYANSADYQKNNGYVDGQLEMAKALELSDEALFKAYEFCKEKNVGFLCTAFEEESVDFLADKLGCSTVKVASPEITNKPLLDYMAQKFSSLILSSGASYLHECMQAVEWIKAHGDKEMVVMHCVSEYPAPVESINLRVLDTLRNTFPYPIGYSDHSLGMVAAIGAAVKGSCVIEKHYTLDKEMQGPDHKASIDIDELKLFISSVKDASNMLGDGIKRPQKCEEENRNLIRKSITCNNNYKKGTVIEAAMLGVKRPFYDDAIEPSDIDKLYGLKLNKDKNYDEPLRWSDFKE